MAPIYTVPGLLSFLFALRRISATVTSFISTEVVSDRKILFLRLGRKEGFGSAIFTFNRSLLILKL